MVFRDTLGMRLRGAYLTFHRLANAHFEPFGVTADQFVVMTLMAERPTPGTAEAGRAFATPTVVHFSASLLVAALVRVPWPQPVFAIWAAGVVGLCGLVPARRCRRQ